jgi:hypothetical protein
MICVRLLVLPFICLLIACGSGQSTSPTRLPAPNSELRARFLRDVTMKEPDGAPIPVEADAAQTKIWELNNPTSTKWDRFTVVAIDRDGEFGQSSVRMPDFVEPGANFQVETALTAPKEPGVYCAIYRLNGMGRNFGPPFWSCIQSKGGGDPATVLRARYLRDITLPDTLDNIPKVAPSSQHTKTWLMRNPMSRDWQGFKLIQIDGDFGPKSVELPKIGAGQEFEVSVPLTMPATCGQHWGIYRLESSEGTNFGPPIWVVVEVAENCQ